MIDEARFLLALAVILIIAKIFAGIMSKLGLPTVIGEIAAGIILGPSVLNDIHPDQPIILTGFIGVVILMFYTGIETDMIQLTRLGKAAFWSALCGVILPFCCGFVFARFIGLGLTPSLFIGTVLTATSVSISAHTLAEIGQLQSREGTVILGAAVADDVMGVIVLSLVFAFNGHTNPIYPIFHIFAYFVIAFIVGKFLIFAVEKYLAHRQHIVETELAISIAIAFIYAWAAQDLGSLAAISGAFLVGLLMGSSTLARSEVSSALRLIGSGFFVPIFFATIGIQADIHKFNILSWFFAGILIIAILTKMGGCYLGARMCKFTNTESLRIGIGMISRGEVALIIDSLALQGHFIDSSIFGTSIGLTIITSLITPILLRFAFPPDRSKLEEDRESYLHDTDLPAIHTVEE